MYQRCTPIVYMTEEKPGADPEIYKGVGVEGGGSGSEFKSGSMATTTLEYGGQGD